MNIRNYYILSLLIVFFFSSFSGLNIELEKEKLIHNGRERIFLVHLPKNHDPSRSYPLVIALHGGNGKAKRFNRSTNNRFNKLADEENFIVVYPQGIDKSWNDHKDRNSFGIARKENVDDVGFINKMIDHLIIKYNVNPQQVFACGISNGGLMSATLAAKLPEKIQAIGMVSSNFSKVYLDDMISNSPAPFPIIIIHGTEDPIFPYEEGYITVFKKNRGDVIGVEKSISYMLTLNGNFSEGIETDLTNNDLFDHCSTQKIVYPNLENPHLKVELLKVFGGGHTWPGGHQYLPKKLIGRVTKDFNAADELWRFFKSTLE